ncbi:calcium-binding protein [Actinoplanes sp. NPDC026623]|uniref:calcium-binding protein n=1 Tax=Actinoplanes sp. NPDC026623 TaxID=3155610 RepID=UPI0033DBFA35
MFLLHRKSLAGLGFTAVAVASTALFAVPAQAASAGLAKVVGSSAVQFNALMGKSNSLTITISGRTVTLNDKVAIKAGKGCKAVRRDKTKVKCTTPKKTTKLSVALGDKTDAVVNATSVYMLADGGTGNDTLTGGSGKDQLQGGTGNDKLYGKAGNDIFFGESGNDTIVGSSGNDQIDAGSGNDSVTGDAGIDELLGGSGKDRLAGGAANDTILGGADIDTIYGDAGVDILFGDAGNDVISGGVGGDRIFGDAGNDKIAGGDGDDLVFGLAGNDQITGGAGDDSLAGEDINAAGIQVGSNSALDRIDGGANTDFCLVMAAGTTANCESPEPGPARPSATASAALSATAIQGARQAESHLAAARAAE